MTNTIHGHSRMLFALLLLPAISVAQNDNAGELRRFVARQAGGIDKLTVTILFDGDFNNCRLLTLKRQ